MNRGLLVLFLGLALSAGAQTNEVPTGWPFQNPDLPVAQRVADLLGRLTIEEKAGLLETEPREVPRLGIPSYSWWGEAIRGVARAGRATQFPQAIGLAATWDTNLMFRIATVISDEARAKFSQVSTGRYHTLTFWAPAADLTRDPRWGRAQETYGEDPLLVSRMAVSFIRGMQGDDPRYLKTAATVKHFGMHGQETGRTAKSFDCPERWLHEYYFPPFRAAATEAKVAGVMAAHNGINSMPCHMNQWLLGDVLRGQWKFDGMIFTDLHGTRNLAGQHFAVADETQAVRAVFAAGVDALDEWKPVGGVVLAALATGNITTAQLDRAVSRGLTQRFRLGLFDPPERVPFAQISTNLIGCAAHIELAREATRASLVLLKNSAPAYRQDRTPLLPLDRRKFDSIAVLGPYAEQTYMGSYTGTPAERPVPVAEGIRAAVGKRTVIRTAPWFDADEQARRKRDFQPALKEADCLAAAWDAAARSDVVVLALGLGTKHEFEGKDRLTLDLPKEQRDFAEKVLELNPLTIVVLFSGGTLADGWLHQRAPAVVQAWLPGDQGGHAIADLLFGEFSPSGRLPVTWYSSLGQVPALTEYDISRERTYLYLSEAPLYPFGHGLSYTRFEYANLRLDRTTVATNGAVQVAFDVTNTGRREGDEVAQLYVRDVAASVPVPLKQLRGFTRIRLAPGETKTVTMPVAVGNLGFWDEKTRAFRVEPGWFEVHVGASSGDVRICGAFRAE